MLNIFPPTSLEELKEALQKIWNSISGKLCEKIIKHMEKGGSYASSIEEED